MVQPLHALVFSKHRLDTQEIYMSAGVCQKERKLGFMFERSGLNIATAA
jgi:hypothetical protein